MKYLSDLEKNTDIKYRVGFVHHMPFHTKHGLGKTREELEQEGILVESVPEPEHIEGKSAVLYCNPATKELWYEYEDIPKTEEEIQQDKINDLEQSVAELTMAMAILLTP